MNNFKTDASAFLGQDAFWMVNKKLVKSINDIKAAFLLSYLVDKEKYHLIRDELIQNKKDGKWYFFAMGEDVEEHTTLSVKEQGRARKVLKNAGLIGHKLMGCPARNHYFVDHDKLYSLILLRFYKRDKLDSTKETNSIEQKVETSFDKRYANNNNKKKKEQKKEQKASVENSFSNLNKFKSEIDKILKSRSGASMKFREAVKDQLGLNWVGSTKENLKRQFIEEYEEQGCPTIQNMFNFIWDTFNQKIKKEDIELESKLSITNDEKYFVDSIESKFEIEISSSDLGKIRKVIQSGLTWWQWDKNLATIKASEPVDFHNVSWATNENQLSKVRNMSKPKLASNWKDLVEYQLSLGKQIPRLYREAMQEQKQVA